MRIADRWFGRLLGQVTIYGKATLPVGGSFNSVSAGWHHTCGGADGRYRRACWGYDYHGQSSPPDGSFASASAGSVHSCGVKTDGTVVCWGMD